MTIKVQLGVTADELELLLASVKGAEQFDVALRGDREREPRLWAMRLRLENDLHKLEKRCASKLTCSKIASKALQLNCESQCNLLPSRMKKLQDQQVAPLRIHDNTCT